MALRNEAADKPSSWVKHPRGSFHGLLKRWKARLERRKAKKDPETNPGYGKYRGYET